MSIETLGSRPEFAPFWPGTGGSGAGIGVATTPTVSLSKYLPIAIASASLGALAVMAMAPRNAQAQMSPTPVQVQAPVQAQPAAPAPVQVAQGEQKLDTSAPILTTNNQAHSKIRTTPDENLPKWVPKKGRLSVVDSSDLAENLGLVPQGTTRKNPEERISVADKLQEERTQRSKDPNNYATSFSYSKAGKFRSKL